MLINIPEEIYTRLQAIAEATQQPVEQVVAKRLKSSLNLPSLPLDEEAELAALEQLSDDALWTIAREQLPRDVQARMQVLMDHNSRGTISDTEYAELGEFVERGQRLTLRKSKAAAILHQRGYEITSNNLMT